MKVVIQNANPMYDGWDFFNFCFKVTGVDIIKSGQESRTDPRLISAVENGCFDGASVVDVPDNATDWCIHSPTYEEEAVLYVVDGKINFVYSLYGDHNNGQTKR